MTEHNIISVSGGKDSTALLLLAVERREYPAANHTKGCPSRIEQLYKRVEVDGTSCIIEPSELTDFLDGGDPTEYKISDVMLAPEQVRRMQEFQGF